MKPQLLSQKTFSPRKANHIQNEHSPPGISYVKLGDFICPPNQTPTQTLKSGFSMFGSNEIGSGFLV